MSLQDFDRCSPSEFDEVCRQWELTHVRDPWERARFLACCMLQPYSKKTLRVTDVCRFDWDKEPSGHGQPHGGSTRERFEELVERMEKSKERK